ncbi:FRG domain-containing protein [Sphingomonas sp. RIT328]|uniref:FRG domain-containing protein n=1 Tax=Sphingomonas sp. RIT328 TaxID=1470591 RepID=UPI00044686AE|nr:FRG domain-containing protein [Sphingomonas sp. RIT328]EZP52981.1 hypothetical protein BW41_02157 [Sphingomonas sp. RIT328]
MFNLVMMGRDEDWDVPIGEPHVASFPLSRYLEYTDVAIAERLKPVDAASLAQVGSLPAVFMSELRSTDAGTLYVTMRTGRVSDLRVDRNVIRYTFALDRHFGCLPVEDRDAFEGALHLGKWEFTRTHWAIKDGALEDSLLALGLTDRRHGAAAQPVTLEPAGEVPVAYPVADSVESFLAHVLGGTIDAEDVFYRGHADHRYALEPSLFRRHPDGGVPRYLRNEAVMVRELLTAHPDEFRSDTFMIDRLVRMQHYGLPTRLLDVTSNPLVALYFCCSESPLDAAGEAVDGQVVIITTKRADIKFFDSDTVSCIANLAMLEDDHKNKMRTDLSIAEFNETDEAKRLLHVIRAEKPYFKPCINPADLSGIVFIKGRNTHARIASQSGAFLLFGHDALLPETGHSNLEVRRITIRNKAAILATLHWMNIKSSTIYPGIEKTSGEIARRYENRG